MTIEEAVYGMVTGDAQLAALVGTRVYPTQAPAKADLPLVVYQEADRKSVMTYGGPKKTNSYTMDLTAWGLSYASAKAVAKRLRDLLNGYSGSGSGVAILGIFDATEADESEVPQHGDERGLFAVSMTLNLWYRAAA